MKRKIYQALAAAVGALSNLRAADIARPTLETDWELHVEALMADAPSGSGFDSGTWLLIDAPTCTNSQLILHTNFHHMDEQGGYDGWTYHDIYVRPSLQFGIELSIKGTNRNGIKDFIAEIFGYWLNSETELLVNVTKEEK